VTFIDSSALGVLVVARTRGVAKEVDVVLRAPSPQVSRVLQITGLDQIFTIEPSP
jgi:anti-sigma B factor antagonist